MVDSCGACVLRVRGSWLIDLDQTLLRELIELDHILDHKPCVGAYEPVGYDLRIARARNDAVQMRQEECLGDKARRLFIVRVAEATVRGDENGFFRIDKIEYGHGVSCSMRTWSADAPANPTHIQGLSSAFFALLILGISNPDSLLGRNGILVAALNVYGYGLSGERPGSGDSYREDRECRLLILRAKALEDLTEFEPNRSRRIVSILKS